jgi:hypothetical protein
MHIYGDTLERYVARELPTEQLTALDSHVTNCLFCAHGLADQTALSSAWERRGWLGRLVRVDAPGSVDDFVEELDAKAA